MKITVLMENTALEGCGLTPEHGLSLYIQYRGKKLLLDAGSSGKFADNAQTLGADLSGVELAVLSHGHYDHGDGLRRFFQVNDSAKAYIRPGANGPHFSMGKNGPYFIGLHREIWAGHQDRFVEVAQPRLLLEGAWLIPDTVRNPDFAGQGDGLLYKRGEDDFVPDDFRHEQSLVLEGEQGLALMKYLLEKVCPFNTMRKIIHSLTKMRKPLLPKNLPLKVQRALNEHRPVNIL